MLATHRFYQFILWLERAFLENRAEGAMEHFLPYRESDGVSFSTPSCVDDVGPLMVICLAWSVDNSTLNDLL